MTGIPVLSPVMLIGQAPGAKEGPAGKPFAWTAGKTMFKWFEDIGVGEEAFRQRVYMAAVCRCFPGKGAKGGDRVPSPDEIQACSRHLEAEVRTLRPALVIPVGKLAIAQVLPDAARAQLVDTVGALHRTKFHGVEVDVIPLPHPSGASTWHRVEPGKALLQRALARIEAHAAWARVRLATAA
ncbi:MAG TPA: uracil-DNA glycosylase family protein [Kofleriaceae bacterium]|nr:uracil-DNA glycosylase family protein [Kofleriaceae bacterium]